MDWEPSAGLSASHNANATCPSPSHWIARFKMWYCKGRASVTGPVFKVMIDSGVRVRSGIGVGASRTHMLPSLVDRCAGGSRTLSRVESGHSPFIWAD